MTSTAAERLVAEAIHSGEMEGPYVSAAGGADADEYVPGRIGSDQLVAVLAPGMDSTNFVDPSLEPEAGVLRNQTGARTTVTLDDAEGDLSFGRPVQRRRSDEPIHYG